MIRSLSVEYAIKECCEAPAFGPGDLMRDAPDPGVQPLASLSFDRIFLLHRTDSRYGAL